MRRRAIVPEVFTYSAAISVCGKRQRPQQAGHLLRVIPRHAIAPDVVTYRAAQAALALLSGPPVRGWRPP